MIGKTILHYKIIEELGRGGMGVVYLAEDTKLERMVALKFFPIQMNASDSEKTRFLQEAKAAAALNHPNVCTIHAIQDQHDPPFMIMEYVQGKDLRDIILDMERGKKGDSATGEGTFLPVSEIVSYAIQIADALQEAHGKGIIHRDIKSDNIMVNTKNQIKVMDFGLAKLKGALRLTKSSSTVGTLAYMSPEHIQGKEADAISDIFSFGVVLYELLTNQLPFQGDYESAIMYSILNEDPKPIIDFRTDVPSGFLYIIERMLEKNPEDRYQSMAEVLRELRRLKKRSSKVSQQQIPAQPSPDDKTDTHSSTIHRESPSLPTESRVNNRQVSNPGIFGNRSGKQLAVVGGVLLLVLLIVGYFLNQFLRTSTSEQIGSVKFFQITTAPEVENFPDISPDGKFIVFARQVNRWNDIFLQRAGGGNAINLTHDSPKDDSQPSFSPNGEQIAFRSERAGGGLFVMGATGESVRRLTDFGYNPVWSPDGKRLLFATELVVNPFGRSSISSLWTVDVKTGETKQILSGDAVQPVFSPHGIRIAFWSLKGQGGQRDIFTIPAEGGAPVEVTNDAAVDWNPVWSPDGKFLYFVSNRGGSMNLWRIPIDEASGKILGEPQPITAPARDIAHIRIARDGRKIVYTSQEGSSNIYKIGFNPQKASVVGSPVPVTRGNQPFVEQDESPDGERLVFRSVSQQEDIYISDMDGKNLRQLTNDVYKDRGPQWSPDGSKIIFYSDRGGKYEFWTIKPDGSELKQITYSPPEVEIFYWPKFFPDGNKIFGVGSEGTYIFEYPTKSNTWEPEILPSLENDQKIFLAFSVSPDGQWLAGFSQARDAGYDNNVIVYSRQTGRYQKLADEGFLPIWLNDNENLIYIGEKGLMLINRKTQKTNPLLPDSQIGYYGTVSISSDNRAIHFSRIELEADIWMAEFKNEN